MDDGSVLKPPPPPRRPGTEGCAAVMKIAATIIENAAALSTIPPPALFQVTALLRTASSLLGGSIPVQMEHQCTELLTTAAGTLERCGSLSAADALQVSGFIKSVAVAMQRAGENSTSMSLPSKTEPQFGVVGYTKESPTGAYALPSLTAAANIVQSTGRMDVYSRPLFNPTITATAKMLQSGDSMPPGACDDWKPSGANLLHPFHPLDGGCPSLGGDNVSEGGDNVSSSDDSTSTSSKPFHQGHPSDECPTEGANTAATSDDGTSTISTQTPILVTRHRTQADALDEVGPNVNTVRTFRSKSRKTKGRPWHTTVLECVCPTCPFFCHVETPTNDVRSHPAVVEIFKEHSHRNKSWVETYDYLVEYDEQKSLQRVPPNFKNVYRTSPGLPNFIRAELLTICEVSPTIRPCDAWTRIHLLYGDRDLLKLSFKNRRRIRTQVCTFVRSRRKNQHTGEPKIETFGQWKRFQRKHLLDLDVVEQCDRFVPELVTGDQETINFAQTLDQNGFLTGKKLEGAFPHRELIVLDDPSVEENERYQELVSSASAQTGPDPRGRTMVFTSIALLTNLCWCDQIGWKVTGSADGTHNVTSEDFTLIVFGFFNINQRGSRQFRPVASCVAEGEREIAALILLLNVRRAARILFGINIPAILGGLVSDHTYVFVNAFKSVFEGLLLQCFTHISRKFMSCETSGNGTYLKYVENLSRDEAIAWLTGIAYSDVVALHLCPTQMAFDKMAELVLAAWIADKQERIAKVFTKEYITNQDFNKWRYNVTGIPGCIPDNNAVESYNVQTKGNQNVSGKIIVKRPFHNFCTDELPKLVSEDSSLCVGVCRSIPVRNPSIGSEDDGYAEYCEKIKPSVDECKLDAEKGIAINDDPKIGFLINSDKYLGIAITDDRIQKWISAMEGKFEKSFHHRGEMLKDLQQFHFVEREKHPQLGYFFRCSCEHYVKWQWCKQSAYKQNGKLDKCDMERIRKRRRSSKRKREQH